MATLALRVSAALLAVVALAGCGSTTPPPAAAPAAAQPDLSLPVGAQYAALDPGWVATSPGARPGATFQVNEAGWFGTQAADGSWRLERRSNDGQALGFVAARQYRGNLDKTIAALRVPGLTIGKPIEGTMAGAPSVQVPVTATQTVTMPGGKPLAGTSLAAGSASTVVVVFLRDEVSAVFVSAPLGTTDPAEWQATAGGVLASLSLR
ncbi:MAG: hypothetical protein JWO46_3005 [Nocardioidaceae bacterium]|nr:hypothetical protein [Nocardioidaceae bacterium]